VTMLQWRRVVRAAPIFICSPISPPGNQRTWVHASPQCPKTAAARRA
jgi:hypothetical protein